MCNYLIQYGINGALYDKLYILKLTSNYTTINVPIKGLPKF